MENSNYEDRVKLQNLLFPEGILWDKVKENYRTMKINKVFEVISLLPNIYNDKKERNDNESASLSPQVELTGVEPVSKRGSNMLSTCLSSPLVFVCQQDRSHQSTPYPLNVHSDYTANRNYSRFYLHLLFEPLRDLAFGRCLVPTSNVGIKLIYYTSIKQRERNYFRQLYFAVYD